MAIHKQSSRAAKRLLHLLSLRHQLECNPVMGLGIVAAVLCTLISGVARVIGTPAWQGFGLIAGFLWMNALMGALCEFFFGRYEPTNDRCFPPDDDTEPRE